MSLDQLLDDQAPDDATVSSPEGPAATTSQRRPRRPVRWSRRRRVIAGLVAAVVVAAAVGTWAATRSSGAAPTTRLVSVTTRTLRSTVAATGTIQPAQTANLSFAVSGQILSVPAAVGEAVKAGQPLATINATSLSTSVAQANATVANDAAKLTSDTNAGATSAQLAADQAALSSAQAGYTVAQTELSSATLTTPIAGKVAAVNLTVGQQVSGGGTTGSGSGGASGSSGGGSGSTGGGSAGSGGGSTGGGSGASGSATSTSGAGSSASGSTASSSAASSSAQVVVISDGSYQVAGTVDDTEVGQVKTGEQVVITPDGSTTPVYGTVGTVGLVPSSTSGVAAYPVTVNVTGNPGGLYPGAGGSLSIVVRQLTGVLAVPTAALHASTTGSYVELMSGGKQVARPVSTGLVSNGYTQITGGLVDGAQIVAPAGVRTRTGTGTGRRTGFGGGTGGLGSFGGGGGTSTSGTRGGGG